MFITVGSVLMIIPGVHIIGCIVVLISWLYFGLFQSVV